MFIKDEKISFTIRTIKLLLKSKQSYMRLSKYIDVHNKPIYKKIKVANPKLPEFNIREGVAADPSYIKYPLWTDGVIGLSSKFEHCKYTRRSNIKYSNTIDFGRHVQYITALHIAYLKLRNSNKKHTHDDQKWITDNNWTYKRVTSTLCEIFQISENAFTNSSTAEVASE